MKSKHFISVVDLTSTEIMNIIQSAARTKHKPAPQVLRQKILALLFEKPSLRTRVSFDVAITQLGGKSLYLSPEEVGLGKREAVEDVAKVIGRYVDCIIARTFKHFSIQSLAEYSGIPVINALSDVEHPCQALADILTIYEKKNGFKGLTLAYIGDGNNVAHSLMLASALVGINFIIASPPGYNVKPEFVEKAKSMAANSGSQLILCSDPMEAVKGVDVIYTDVWTSMGQEREAEDRRRIFQGYQVDTKLISLAHKDVIFMHPLPAHHGEEIAQGILQHPSSVVFDQAENRLHAQRTLLIEMFR